MKKKKKNKQTNKQTRKSGKGNLWCVADNHNYPCHTYTKWFLYLKFDQAIIDKISNVRNCPIFFLWGHSVMLLEIKFHYFKNPFFFTKRVEPIWIFTFVKNKRWTIFKAFYLSILFLFVLFIFYFLFLFILSYFILFYFILFYFILFYFILFYFILFYFILYWGITLGDFTEKIPSLKENL